MRVIAGQLRGRPIAVPAKGTRPTTDMVRGSIANSLVSLDAIDGARIADLYAGSGAMGIELLSRGAAHCTFVERAPDAVRVIRANLTKLGLTDRATCWAPTPSAQCARSAPSTSWSPTRRTGSAVGTSCSERCAPGWPCWRATEPSIRLPAGG